LRPGHAALEARGQQVGIVQDREHRDVVDAQRLVDPHPGMIELGQLMFQVNVRYERERLVARASGEREAHRAPDTAPAQYPTDCRRPDKPHDPQLRNDTNPGPSYARPKGKTVPYRSCDVSPGGQRPCLEFWLDL